MDHALRRARLLEVVSELGLDAVLVTRLPNVRYLSGFTGSNGQLVLGPGGAILLTDGRYETQAGKESPDLELRIYRDEATPHLAQALADLGAARAGFEREGLTYGAWCRLAEVAGSIELVPTERLVERLRASKDPEERERIARAQAVADEAFEAVVLGGLREGATERELALALEVAMRRAGAEDRGFETIVAFGEHAAEPHHEPTDRPLRRGDVVKVDMGATVDGYRSDMTRTVAFGAVRPRLREVHEVVAAAQAAGIAAARPGASLREVDRAARRVVEEAGLGEAFPHGLGHGVGLEIHEVPFLRSDAPPEEVLPEGAIVTIEPGVYLPGLGGVRIEDMVLVTAEGPTLLGRSPRELLDVGP